MEQSCLKLCLIVFLPQLLNPSLHAAPSLIQSMFLKHELTCLLPVFVSAEEAQGAPSPEGLYWKGRPRCRGALPVAWREDTGLEP